MRTRNLRVPPQFRLLLAEISALNQYLRSNIFWVRSVSGWLVPDISSVFGAVPSFATHPDWVEIYQRHRVALFLIGIVAFGVAFGLRFLRRRWPSSAWTAVATETQPGARETLRLLLGTAVRAAPIPVILLAFAMVLRGSSDLTLARMLSAGLFASAGFLFVSRFTVLSLARGGGGRLCIPGGERFCDTVLPGLRWLERLLVPLVFVVFLFAAEGMQFQGTLEVRQFNDGIGRLCFLLAWLAFAGFRVWLHRLHRAGGQPGAEWTEGFPLARHLRIRFVTLFPLLVIPLAALLGYYATALAVSLFLFETLVLAAALWLSYMLLRQWQNDRTGHELPIPDQEKQEFEEVRMNRLRFFRAALAIVWILGTFGIWSPILPALRVLDQVRKFGQAGVIVDNHCVSIARNRRVLEYSMQPS